jgi:hypothetical protein
MSDSIPIKKNKKWEQFCKVYVSETEFFGNGTQSYIEVYKPKRVGNWYRSSQVSASRLLSNPIIIDRINELLQLQGLNDTAVDKQLSFIIAQYSDLTNKMAAIREYNKLKQRIVDKTDITGDIKISFDSSFLNATTPKAKRNS